MSLGDDFFAANLGATSTVAIFRNNSPEKTIENCHKAWAAGIQLVEIPVQDELTMESFLAAVEEGNKTGKLVGAGTVTTPKSLECVINNGADFAVAPGVSQETMQAANARGFPLLPGVATASDIMLARALGYTWLKAFPASVLGSDWIKAQHGPFPGVHFIATGGVNASNASTFLEAGCSGVALGSSFSESFIQSRAHVGRRVV